ncbi:hypothetical protein [Sulfurimonas marina]|uniref:PilN domain-containing protein n=1 Tax=Sulfurimonas marina TaxID=2590551 RepID=A0A7M1AW58_9BACT|nr:hypothetical protein [Sulfurimonas marina]QOP40602.1 hypothetical protein FJR03_02130 [Sulfurimonas marina]
MKYSYIKPRTKTPFTQELKLLVTFFSMTLIMIFSTFIFLVYKDYSFQKEKAETIEARLELQKDIENMKNQITYIKKQKDLSERIFTKNSVLKDSITNLFDLVPERITLSEAKLLENGLVLYGITPNKDVYNFMLQAPLRSIFHKTYSSFYPAGNGWLRFVSTNYIDEMDQELENEN